MLVSNWLEHHQVIVASLINVSVVVAISFITNQLQFRRENQRWQREKIYNLYEDVRKCFSELLKPITPTSINIPINISNYTFETSDVKILSTILSLSKLTSVSYNQTLEDIESIKADLMKILEDKTKMSIGDLPVKIHLLSEKLEGVIKRDSRLKDLFK